MHQSEKHLISPKGILMLSGASVLCLITGSFIDYQLSTALFNAENPLGLLLAAYGQFPTAAAMSIAGVIFILTFDRAHIATSIGLSLFGVLLNALSFLITTYGSLSYLPLDPSAAALIAVMLLATADIMVLRALSGASAAQLRMFGAFLVVLVIAQLIVVNIIKILWERPRMRMIAATDSASFQPWWVIGSVQKDALSALGIAAEEFKSFPSGHTACAACAMALVALPAVKPSLARWSHVFLYGAVLFTTLVAISRIIMGAHFLTDVTAGFTISFLILLACLYIFYGNRVPLDSGER